MSTTHHHIPARVRLRAQPCKHAYTIHTHARAHTHARTHARTHTLTRSWARTHRDIVTEARAHPCVTACAGTHARPQARSRPHMCNTRCTPYTLCDASGMYHLRPLWGLRASILGRRDQGLGLTRQRACPGSRFRFAQDSVAVLRALGVIPGTLTSCLEGPHAQGKMLCCALKPGGNSQAL